MNYTMIDGVQRNMEFPATFEVPTALAKAKIKPGDFVKVGFEPLHGEHPVERMWVKVTKVSGENIEGVLSNDPMAFPPTVLKDGDEVRLTMAHVLDVLEGA